MTFSNRYASGIVIHCRELRISVHSLQQPRSRESSASAEFKQVCRRFGSCQRAQQSARQHVRAHTKAERDSVGLNQRKRGRQGKIIKLVHLRQSSWSAVCRSSFARISSASATRL